MSDFAQDPSAPSTLTSLEDHARSAWRRRWAAAILAVPTLGISLGLAGVGARLEGASLLSWWYAAPRRKNCLRVGAVGWLVAVVAMASTSVMSFWPLAILLPAFAFLTLGALELVWAAFATGDPFVILESEGEESPYGPFSKLLRSMSARWPTWARHLVALEWVWTLGLSFAGACFALCAIVAAALYVAIIVTIAVVMLYVGLRIALFVLAHALGGGDGSTESGVVRNSEPVDHPPIFPPPIPEDGLYAIDGRKRFQRVEDKIYRVRPGYPLELIGLVRGDVVYKDRGARSPVPVARFKGAEIHDPSTGEWLASVEGDRIVHYSGRRSKVWYALEPIEAEVRS